MDRYVVVAVRRQDAAVSKVYDGPDADEAHVLAERHTDVQTKAVVVGI